MQLAAQSNWEPTVAQLMLNWAHVTPKPQLATWAHAMSHGVFPPLVDDELVDEVVVLLVLLVVVLLVTVWAVTCPPAPVVPPVVFWFTVPPQPANQATVAHSDAAKPQA